MTFCFVQNIGWKAGEIWVMVTKNGEIKRFMGWGWAKDGSMSSILTPAPLPVYETPHLTSHFQTFVVISKGKDIFRFSAEDSMWFLSPFSPVRRVAIHVLVHPLFSLIIIVTILLNCIMMILPPTEQIESTEWVRKLYWFILTLCFQGSLYSNIHIWVSNEGDGKGLCPDQVHLPEGRLELARLHRHLPRLPHHGHRPGQPCCPKNFQSVESPKDCRHHSRWALSATRWSHTNLVSGLKTIVGAVIESVKNLRDVIILTVFALSVFALLGLQIYMGVLTQKCIKNFTYWNELDHGSWGEGHQAWVQFNNNHTNWYRREEMKNYQLCGNSSGAGPCPEHYVCLEVFFTSSSFFQHITFVCRLFLATVVLSACIIPLHFRVLVITLTTGIQISTHLAGPFSARSALWPRISGKISTKQCSGFNWPPSSI